VHQEFWRSAQYREAIGKPGFSVENSTLVVAMRFRLIEDLRGRHSGRDQHSFTEHA
jgi:hypothetical protein